MVCQHLAKSRVEADVMLCSTFALEVRYTFAVHTFTTFLGGGWLTMFMQDVEQGTMGIGRMEADVPSRSPPFQRGHCHVEA